MVHWTQGNQKPLYPISLTFLKDPGVQPVTEQKHPTTMQLIKTLAIYTMATMTLIPANSGLGGLGLANAEAAAAIADTEDWKVRFLCIAAMRYAVELHAYRLCTCNG